MAHASIHHEEYDEVPQGKNITLTAKSGPAFAHIVFSCLKYIFDAVSISDEELIRAHVDPDQAVK